MEANHPTSNQTDMKPQHLELQSADGTQLNLDALYQIAPACFTEAMDKDGKVSRKVNFDVLRQLLGDATAESGEELYQFTWPGKAEARREAARPIRKTLRPVPEDSVDWDTTQNLYIEGDNLEVLKLLQKTYLGKVKMIYIDPPYNTGNDFVYNDTFKVESEKFKVEIGDTDEEGNRYRRNTDSNGRFHSDWCSMIYPRLQLARTLLAEDGVIFISIDDNEIENLRKICDEVFGISNFVAQLIWKKKQGGGNDSNHIVAEHEYVLVFCKNINALSLGLDKNYKLDDALYPYSDDTGDYGLITLDKASIQFSQSLVFDIIGPDGTAYRPRIVKGKQSCWRWSKAKVENQYNDLVFKNGKVYTKYYRPDGVTPRSLLIDAVYGRTESGNDDIKSLFKRNPFSYPKPVALVKHLLSIGSINNDIVLDFFSGSGTFGQAVILLNAEDGGSRRFIMVQLPEETDKDSEAAKAGYYTICEISKERIRRAGKKIKEEAGLQGQDLDTGFRVLRIDSSNMEDVYFHPDAFSQDKLDMLLDNVKADRTDLDLLFGAMLDLGLQLSLPIVTKKVKCEKLKVEIPVYVVNEGDLVACFSPHISEEVIDVIAEQSPRRVLLRDSCFSSDAAKINIFEQFKQRLGWSDDEAYKRIRVI